MAVTLLTLSTMGVLLTVLGVVLATAPRLEINANPVTQIGQTRASLVIVLAGAIQAFCLLAVLIAVGWADYLERQHLSPLYGPVLTTALGVVLVLTISGLSAFSLLNSDLRERWVLFNEPEVRLASTFGLALTVSGLGWKAWVILAGRGKSKRWIAVLYAGQAALTAAIVAAAVWG